MAGPGSGPTQPHDARQLKMSQWMQRQRLQGSIAACLVLNTSHDPCAGLTKRAALATSDNETESLTQQTPTVTGMRGCSAAQVGRPLMSAGQARAVIGHAFSH